MKGNSISRKKLTSSHKRGFFFTIVPMKEEDILETYITYHILPPLPLSYKLISF